MPERKPSEGPFFLRKKVSLWRRRKTPPGQQARTTKWAVQPLHVPKTSCNFKKNKKKKKGLRPFEPNCAEKKGGDGVNQPPSRGSRRRSLKRSRLGGGFS